MKNVYIDCEFSGLLSSDIVAFAAVSGADEFYMKNSDLACNLQHNCIVSYMMSDLDEQDYTVVHQPFNEISSKFVLWLESLQCSQINILTDFKDDISVLQRMIPEGYQKIVTIQHISQEIRQAAQDLGCSAVAMFNIRFHNYILDNKIDKRNALTDARALQAAHVDTGTDLLAVAA